MGVINYKSGGSWSSVNRPYYKSGGAWTEGQVVYYRSGGSWTIVHPNSLFSASMASTNMGGGLYGMSGFSTDVNGKQFRFYHDDGGNVTYAFYLADVAETYWNAVDWADRSNLLLRNTRTEFRVYNGLDTRWTFSGDPLNLQANAGAAGVVLTLYGQG